MKNKREINIHSSTAEYLTFIASVGDSEQSVEMRYEDENIWLTQKMMAELYDVSVSAINQHIKKIYDDGELTQESTIKKYLIVQQEGERTVSRPVNHYNLQMIIAVGFKIDNDRAVQFRKWAGQIVKDYTNKSSFNWISVIRLPDFITKEDFEWAVENAAKKKKMDCSSAEFMTIDEGMCVQIMHLGAFDDEPATVAIMDEYLKQNGYVNDMNMERLHHEIYLSDARKVAPEKWKTVIRHPIKKL